MGSIPFTVYDFFSYLAVGGLWLLGVDYAFALGWILGKDLDPGRAIAWIIVSQLLGHVNSHWSSWLLETRSMRILGYPSTNFFASVTPRFLRHYRAPLEKELGAAILEKYTRESRLHEQGESLFLFCFHTVKERDARTYARLETFLNQYAFARNMSLALLVLGGVFVAAAVLRDAHQFWALAAACLVTSITLFLRYLKFFRHYSLEVFMAFLVATSPATERK